MAQDYAIAAGVDRAWATGLPRLITFARPPAPLEKRGVILSQLKLPRLIQNNAENRF